ncbi:MAG: MFS transporter [Chloroflexi bacterium]|nr:MFS transporter [Chloroflexota bacterium]
MRLPSRDSIEGLRPISRNLSLDLAAAIGLGIAGALVSSLLPTIARRGGLEPLGLAVLAATPFLTNLLSIFSGRIGPQTARQFALLRMAGAGSLVLLLVISPAVVIIAVALVFWISVSFSSPFQLRLWGATYPARMRGRVVGFLGTGRAAAAAAAALIGGVLADRIGGPPAVALAGLVGAACSLAYWWFRASAAAAPAAYSARESIAAMRGRPTLGRVALAQGFFGGGFIAAGPLFALVNVDRLDLSLADVGIIGVLTAAATTISFLIWGAVSDHVDVLAPMRFGSIIGLGGLIAYALAPGVAVLWLAAVAIGTANSSIEIGVAGVISAETPLATRAAAMSGWNAITGARGLVAPFLMSGLVQVGLLSVTAALLLCAVASGLGVALFWWASSRARNEVAMRMAPDGLA